jgi:hypothetical protein
MARTAVRLVFAAMLALLATQAPMPSVRVVAAFEILWLAQSPAQSNVRQRAPRKIQRSARTTRDRREPQTYVSLVAAEPDVVLIYQLPPPVSSFAS